MSSSPGIAIQRQIRSLVESQCKPSDAHLLQQFLDHRDEAAFAGLVKRHGSMVLAVCLGVLHHQQDAEDAFQAAFLVLARKASSIRKQGSLGSWLHGVASRLARKLAARTGRRRERETLTYEPSDSSWTDDLATHELRGVVHEELDRLGETHRASLLLCYWEGKTRDEAAEQLGMTAGAFKKRLEQARHLLGRRLARRGLVLSAPLFATLLASSGVQAALPGPLLQSTAHAAATFSVGAIAGTSPAAVALAQGAIQAMTVTKGATIVAVILLLTGLGTSLGLGVYHLTASEKAAATQGVAFAGGQGQPTQSKSATTDKERIVGVWRFVKGTAEGMELIPADLASLGRYTFTKKGTYVLSFLEEAKKGKYDLVGAGKIDFTISDKETAEGIYRFDGGDRLTLCIDNQRKQRPTEFKADKGSGSILFSLVRAKPGEEKPSAEEIAKNKPAVDRVKEAAARSESMNNLKQIGLAFHNAHSIGKAFPAQAIYAKDGKTPLLSWRVAILPFIDHQHLYQQFKLNEPWDSDHNKKLIPKMPRIYVTGGASKAKPGETHYQVFTGPGTVFDGARAMKIADITDGTSNTVLAFEAKDPVIWTRPSDLPLPADKEKLPAVGENFSNGFNVLFCDGSVRFVSRTVAPATFRALITAAAGDQ